jgi:hypothetical protein
MGLKPKIKRLLRLTAPGLAGAIERRSARRHNGRRERRLGLSATIFNRFTSTHEIVLAGADQRPSAEYPSLSFLLPEDRELALSAMRDRDQRWAFLKGKSRFSTALP